MMRFFYSVSIAMLLAGTGHAQVIWQEAEAFSQAGGWSNDSQHVDIMGSPYLLATGVGKSVEDAVTTVPVVKAGRYRLWVRCRDWFPSHAPGQFQVSVAGKASATSFGKARDDEWRWVDGGEFSLKAGEIELRLHDTTGWWGRCDALVLAAEGFRPEDRATLLAKQRLTHAGVSGTVKVMSGYDVVVVGGGSSGLGAALAAARCGIKVAFIQDRPVLGGNGSDEIRVPPMGMIGNAADKVNVTGIAEEIFPVQGWTNFASSSYIEKIVAAEDNIDLHLNTRATGVEMSDVETIGAVMAIDVHSGRRLRFVAPLFVDTTGHGWVGHYAGAHSRMGTEARAQFDEPMAPIDARSHTMGNSLYKAVFEDTGKPTEFVRPDWAYKWEKPSDFDGVQRRIKEAIRPAEFEAAVPGKGRRIRSTTGLGLAGTYTWYVETGGMSDTIQDAERIRDELFRIHIGLWNYAKNHDPKTRAFCRTRRMSWLNYVPGVRESRRLMGDYIMTQRDFDDICEHDDNVAFTDWGIDDHHPLGYWVKGIDVMHVYHGRRVSIPYRSLYSRNIVNLFIAGRCMSVSHIALGGVRVQRPMCATGQVVGTAAAIATEHSVSPRGVYKSHLRQLQQRLLRDGCYIAKVKNEDPADLALKGTSRNPEIINGWNRESRQLPNGADWRRPITLELEAPAPISEVHLTLNQGRYSGQFKVEAKTAVGWETVATRQLTKATSARRFVFRLEALAVSQLRFTLLESDKPLRICEVRVYE